MASRQLNAANGKRFESRTNNPMFLTKKGLSYQYQQEHNPTIGSNIEMFRQGYVLNVLIEEWSVLAPALALSPVACIIAF